MRKNHKILGFSESANCLESSNDITLCRFITCGSVDDGKSTLIGRLLYDTQSLFTDQLNTLEKESKKLGTQNGDLDFALLVDGLSSEREQGITIDVAYRFFTSKKNRFIIADSPGHEQYTRNMATAASTADIAIILIDARKGVLTQTKRHSYIASLFGIRHFIIAVNKMDLIDYDEAQFSVICKDYEAILKELESSINVSYIPISALKGENVTTNKTQNLKWYKGKTLLEALEDSSIKAKSAQNPQSKAQDSSAQKDFLQTDFLQNEFILPVQYVNRPNSDFRAFCGQIASGSIKLGDEVIILPSMQKSRVSKIIANEITNPQNPQILQTTANKAHQSMSISLCLQDERDISRGDVIACVNNSLKLSNTFKAMVIWFSDLPLELSTSYLLKSTHNLCNVAFTSIEYKKDMQTFTNIKTNTLHLNDIAKCALKLDKALPLQTYSQNKIIGSFIIIDKYSNQTLGAGMIDVISKNAQSRQIPESSAQDFIVDSKNLESKDFQDSTQDSSANKLDSRIYLDSEIALNAFIRKHYPEWGCKKI